MKKMKRWASVLLILCMLLAGTPAPAESGGALTGTPMAEQSAEPENTATAEPENTATAEPENTATAEPENTATAEPENTATAEPENTATAEPENTATVEPENTATAEPANTATAEPENTATAEPANTAVPTDAAEVKTIASFEAVAPEGFAVPQGTPETGLGLPASLNVQFADGAAGEVAVTWQCAAGYDPNAEAGTQFAFAAVLPEGYALAEGVSLPQILVTLTPPLANAMLMAATSGKGWTLSNDGTLTVTGIVTSSDIPSFASAVKSIEVAGSANFILAPNVSFSGSIKVLANGHFCNDGNFSGNINVESGGTFDNYDTISGGTITGSVSNNGTITGGTFHGSVDNKGGTITGGTFYDNVNNESGTITGGTFNGNLSNDNGGRVQGQDANVPTINGAIENENGSSILQPCNFGGNAHVRSNTGAIQVTMFVNGEAKAFNYGANILESLGGGTWCLLNEDSFSVCGANDTFGLQTRSYGKLSAPSVTLDYETESITVTVPDYLAGLTAEDEVYLGFPLDILTTWEEWNDVFASSGSYTSTLSRINSINEMFTGNPLPRDAGDGDVEIPVFFGSGTVVSDAYPGAVTTLVVPERPECGQVEPLALITDVDRLGIDAALCDTYDFGLAPAGDPAPDTPTILDEDGDGLITGLKEGEEYIVYLRLKATDSSFRSAWQEQGSATTVAATYTVTYTDGVDGEEIFADQVTGDLLEGEATPAFSGTPEREGYMFAGWNPAVSATVSGDVTYTATWMKESTGERDSYDPSEIARKLAAGKAVEGLVTDRFGTAMPYAPLTKRTLDTASGKEIQRTLVITADPLLDENGQPILRDGGPVYEQRNLHLSRGLLDALTSLGYTHIRFALGDAALEWQIAEMTEDGYVVRLAPMEADELSQAEKDAIGAVETLTGSYRARVTAVIEGEEVDVTNAIPSLTVIFDAESVRKLAKGEAAQLLLVPNDGEPEAQVSFVQYIEETDTEKARYEAPLMESGLFVMTLQ